MTSAAVSPGVLTVIHDIGRQGPWPGIVWRVHWAGLSAGWPEQHVRPQSAAFTLGLGSKSVHACFKSLVSHSPSVALLIYKPGNGVTLPGARLQGWGTQ